MAVCVEPEVATLTLFAHPYRTLGDTVSRIARSRSAMPAVLASVLVGTVPLVSACGAGQKAPTRLEYSVADGVAAHAGNVALRNLQLIADVGDGHKAATTLDLQGLVANNTGSDETLTSVTAADGTTATVAFAVVTPTAAPTSASPTTNRIVTGQPLMLGSQGLHLQVTGLKTPALPGSLVSLTFSFKSSGNVTVAVPVYYLASRTEPESTATITYPAPEVPENFTEQEYDNQAAPSS